VSGRSLVQRSPTECGVSEYDREALRVRRPWGTRDCRAVKSTMMRSIETPCLLVDVKDSVGNATYIEKGYKPGSVGERNEANAVGLLLSSLGKKREEKS
jgi:hypothetical protein